MLSDEKDLCEDEGVHDCESMLLGIQMKLRHDDALVEGEQSEDDPEIEEDDEKAPELCRGFLFEVGFSSAEVLVAIWALLDF